MTTVKHHYPVYLVEECPEIHNSLRYPIEAVSDKYLKNLDREGSSIQYFTSSFCYMLALALYEGFEDIYVSGFEMGSDTEYVYQKAGAEFWMGIVSQHARLHLPDGSHLLKARLYGFDTDGQIITREVLDEYHSWYLNRHDELSHQPIKETWIEMQMIVGAVSFLEEVIRRDGAVTRQVLEAHKEDWDKKRRKFQSEVNALNAQGWEKHMHNEDSEKLSQMAFERIKYMYRYDGAHQLAVKLIGECDLQKPDKKLLNRHQFQRFSEVKEIEPA